MNGSTEKEKTAGAKGTVADPAVEQDAAETADEEIRSTDIVFDCPHCGHNLVIDYRGAGLQTHCVECGASVLVPIPDGMKIDDLDLSPGELLTQLFQTRRMLQKSEQDAAELRESLDTLKGRRAELERARMSTLHRYAEMVGMCQNCLKLLNESGAAISRIIAMIGEEQR